MIITVNIAKSRFNMNASEGNFLSNTDSSGFPPETSRWRMHAELVPADAWAPVPKFRHADGGTRAFRTIPQRFRSHSPAIPQRLVMASLLQYPNVQEEDFI